MRHTFATLARATGADLSWLSKQLGHESIRTTNKHYARFVPPSTNGISALWTISPPKRLKLCQKRAIRASSGEIGQAQKERNGPIYRPVLDGASRTRTGDLLGAIQAVYSGRNRMIEPLSPALVSFPQHLPQHAEGCSPVGQRLCMSGTRIDEPHFMPAAGMAAHGSRAARSGRSGQLPSGRGQRTQQAHICRAFMEFAGLEPANSWVCFHALFPREPHGYEVFDLVNVFANSLPTSAP
jgi:hypothetical protein